jgi:excisionase family DNA binding protein
MPAASPAPVAVPVAEAARMLGISRSQAYQLVRDDKSPTVRSLGKLVVPVRWIEDQVEQALDEWNRRHRLQAVAS